MKFETNFDGMSIQKEYGIDGIAFGEGMEAILSAGNNGRNAEHTTTIHASKLIFKVAANHVAEFADRVPDLTFGIGDFRTEHTGGDLSSSFGAAADGENATECPGQADHGSEIPTGGLQIVFCRIDSAAQHDLEDFLRGQFEDRQPVLRMRVDVRR